MPLQCFGLQLGLFEKDDLHHLLQRPLPKQFGNRSVPRRLSTNSTLSIGTHLQVTFGHYEHIMTVCFPVNGFGSFPSPDIGVFWNDGAKFCN